jgi:hypothetical protein
MTGSEGPSAVTGTRAVALRHGLEGDLASARTTIDALTSAVIDR